MAECWCNISLKFSTFWNWWTWIYLRFRDALLLFNAFINSIGTHFSATPTIFPHPRDQRIISNLPYITHFASLSSTLDFYINMRLLQCNMPLPKINFCGNWVLSATFIAFKSCASPRPPSVPFLFLRKISQPSWIGFQAPQSHPGISNCPWLSIS